MPFGHVRSANAQVPPRTDEQAVGLSRERSRLFPTVGHILCSAIGLSHKTSVG